MNTRIPFAKADAGASAGAAAFLEDLIDACVMESGERMKYEGKRMKWGSFPGSFSSFIIHPSAFLSLLAIIKAVKGSVLTIDNRLRLTCP